MKMRKTILLAACAALLAVCIVQAIMSLKPPVEELTLSESPDKITITGAGLDVLLTLEGNTWYVGSDNFSVSAADSGRILNAVKEIKVLDVIGKTGNEAMEERYELDAAKAITVTAFKADKTLRTITVGKTSSTGSQTYIALDGKKDILLAATNLRSAFDKSADDLRSKNVYSFSKNDITAVSVTQNGSAWGAERHEGDGGAAEWSATGSAAGTELDKDKTDSWVQQLASLLVSSWLENSAELPAEKAAEAEILTAADKATVSLYRVEDGGDDSYYCTSNKTPHKFTLTKSAAEKFLKTADALKK